MTGKEKKREAGTKPASRSSFFNPKNRVYSSLSVRLIRSFCKSLYSSTK